MDSANVLTELETLAAKLEVEVVYDHLTGEGAGTGGLCKVKGQWRVIIERRSSTSEKVSILARALGRFDLESFFVSPSVREILERHAPSSRPVEEGTGPEPAD